MASWIAVERESYIFLKTNSSIASTYNIGRLIDIATRLFDSLYFLRASIPVDAMVFTCFLIFTPFLAGIRATVVFCFPTFSKRAHRFMIDLLFFSKY